MLLLSALSLRAIIQNNKLVNIKLISSLTELRTALKKELEQSGWKVNRSNVKYLTAYKTGFWLHGTKIAVLFNNNVAYINVQNLYGIGAYFPFSFGRNKQYTTVISQIIKDCEEANL
ncbi:MAG: hypothetical protein JWO06_3633 [Bacteroidota bacterium]|nr:hypothetical protein [Bacteroidota bacterium]